MIKYWWFPFFSTVDVVFQGVRVLYRINKDEGDDSLLLQAFRRDVVNDFLKYSKEGKLSLIHIGIRNIPSDFCYDGTKHSQV